MSGQPLSRAFFDHNPKIDQKDRIPYPEYRYTKYFWTINLQQAAYTREQAEYLVNLLRKAVLDVFTKGGAVAFAHQNHRWNNIYIGENDLKLAIEVGPKKGRIHAHLIQEVKHRSVINIDAQDVKARINELLAQWTGGRVTNVYIHRTHHPSSRPLEEYLDKDNQPWRQIGHQASGLFAYTLVYDAQQTGTWKAYDTTPREITIPVDMEVSEPSVPLPVGPSVRPIPVPSYLPPWTNPVSGPIAASSTEVEFPGIFTKGR